MIKANSLKSILILLHIIGVFILSIIALKKYPGNQLIFISFCLISNAMLYYSFRRKAIFFDTFFGTFIWMGFWVKFIYRIGFVGTFFTLAPSLDLSGQAFDRGLIVSIVAMLAIMVASFIREKFLYFYPKVHSKKIKYKDLLAYEKHRKFLLISFAILVLAVVISNMNFHIYQRGTIPLPSVPWIFLKLYAWLLQFGLASFAAMFIFYEINHKNKFPFLALTFGILESFLSSISLISRNFFLNAGALLYAFFHALHKYARTIMVRQLLIILTGFVILTAISIITVNFYRLHFYTTVSQIALEKETNIVNLSDPTRPIEPPNKYGSVSFENIKYMTTSIFIDRWVGVEEVLEISNNKHLGWELWNDAWKERFAQKEGEPSFYGENFSRVKELDLDKSRFYFLSSLPGIVGFLYYPGSLIFLFISLIFLSLIAAGIEYLSFRLCSGNLILCAVFANAIAFRYLNFGYAPQNTLIFFTTFLINILIIYLIKKLILNYGKS